MRARADSFRTLARSWTALAKRRPFASAGQLRRAASAALFAAYEIDEVLAGRPPRIDLEREPALATRLERLQAIAARTRAALELARRVEVRLNSLLAPRVDVPGPSPCRIQGPAKSLSRRLRGPV